MARRKTTRLAFDALIVEGALITPDMIADVAALKATAQSEADYRIPPGLKLRDEIGRSWRIAEALWARFSQARAGGPPYAATQAFVDELLRQVFGFSSLEAVASREVGSRTFPVRRVALGGRVPIAVAPAGEGLDRGLDQFAEEHRKRSASLFVQELLNADEAASWGIATDGLKLRLLRDNASLTRPAYIEADLERIFKGGLYADFVALWLLIHESRFGATDALPSDCPLERWREAGREAGAKARDRLGVGVEAALIEFGTGFIEHPANGALRDAVEGGTLTSQALYEELLRLVYRLIFLFTTEDRGLLRDPDAGEAAKALYACGYSLARLRAQAARRAARDANHDLYEGLKIVFRSLWRGEKALGLPALGGLFRGSALPNLGEAKISNKRLLDAVFGLAWITENHTLTRVNWRDMETEELGSVYEALLELTPRVNLEARSFFFAEGAETKGNARKTSGSYYTPDSLVQLLLDSALEPVIERTVNENPGRAVDALLDLTVLDPACGSGHFLLAAGRRIATRVAQIRSPGAPSADDWRHALREVARHCLFGVDRNPMAVELCQTALWIESVDPGKPLTFLDAHIQCGDSLIGVSDLAALARGIPDEAYKALIGDDKSVASSVRKVNKRQREQPKQRSLFATGPADLSSQARGLEGLPEDDLREVEAKARAFESYRQGVSWWTTKVACDLYVGAFFRPKTRREGALASSNAADDVPTTADVWAALQGHPPQGSLTARATEATAQVGAFHWPLAFPQVLEKGGFDCVVGNPPWERIKLQEVEFFSSRNEEIAKAPTASKRKVLVERLAAAPADSWERKLYTEYSFHKRAAEATAVFCRSSGRFEKSSVGDFNTYALFTECALGLIRLTGSAGIIVPSGIATESATSELFGYMSANGFIKSFFDFENRSGFFRGLHTKHKFAAISVFKQRSHIIDLCFFASEIQDIQDDRKRLRLSENDIELFNPNTKTLPVIRAKRDLELLRRIYTNSSTLIDSRKASNPWGAGFLRMFDMTLDSGLFEETRVGDALPLYEAKMFWHFDHRWANATESTDNQISDEMKANPDLAARSRFFVARSEVDAKLNSRGWNKDWLLAYRNVSDSRNERTFVASIIPRCAVGNSATVLTVDTKHVAKVCCFLANANSIVFDFAVRQKVPAMNVNAFMVEQFPFLTPDQYEPADVSFITERVVELVCTASDMHNFAIEYGGSGQLYSWNADRRAVLRAELDARIAKLYGLTTDDLRYLLDPTNVMGDGYPSETFRVLQDNERKKYGEYRTARLVIAAWNQLPSGLLGQRTATVTTDRLPIISAPPADLSSQSDGAWARHDQNSAAAAQAILAAVLKALRGAAPTRLVRQAAVLGLEPRALLHRLTPDEQVQWRRLVGAEAEPLQGVTRLLQANNAAWREATIHLRATGRLLESLADDTWEAGPGLELFPTAGWADGRAQFVLRVLQRTAADPVLEDAEIEEQINALAG